MMSDAEIDDLYRQIGRRIAMARSRRGSGSWSQTELAATVGVARGTVANIESGRQRPPIHTLWRIANALQIEPRLLLPVEAEVSGASTLNSSSDPTTEAGVERLVRAMGDSRALLESWI